MSVIGSAWQARNRQNSMCMHTCMHAVQAPTDLEAGQAAGAQLAQARVLQGGGRLLALRLCAPSASLLHLLCLLLRHYHHHPAQGGGRSLSNLFNMHKSACVLRLCSRALLLSTHHPSLQVLLHVVDSGNISSTKFTASSLRVGTGNESTHSL